MSQYRVTIRHGAPRMQYHLFDVTADSLVEALRLAAEQFPSVQGADLVEIRLMPEERPA